MQEGAGWFLDGLFMMFGGFGVLFGFGVFGLELLTGLRYKGIYDGLCICCAGLDLVFNFFPQ